MRLGGAEPAPIAVIGKGSVVPWGRTSRSGPGGAGGRRGALGGSTGWCRQRRSGDNPRDWEYAGGGVAKPGASAALPHQTLLLHGWAGSRFASRRRRGPPAPPPLPAGGRAGGRRRGGCQGNRALRGAAGITWAARTAPPSSVRAEAPGGDR